MRALGVLAVVGALSLTAPPSAAVRSTGARSAPATSATSAEAPIPVPPSNTPPSGRRLSANGVIAIAERLPKVRSK